jgi:inhibitor of KinA
MLPLNDVSPSKEAGGNQTPRTARYLPAGDRALSVEFGSTISEDLNQRVLQFDNLLRKACLPGIVETVPSYRALLVYYDPLVIEYEDLVEQLRRWEVEIAPQVVEPPRLVEIPCCYDPELGFDLMAVGTQHGLTAQDVIRIHSSAHYITYFIGFAPGFPYLGGLPEEIFTPRLVRPRDKIPAGSVGIGGGQCTIYSVESPGGFWILGRTPLRLYDPSASQPVLLRAGDRIRFHPVDRAEYEQMYRSVAAGTFRTNIQESA